MLVGSRDLLKWVYWSFDELRLATDYLVFEVSSSCAERIGKVVVNFVRLAFIGLRF